MKIKNAIKIQNYVVLGLLNGGELNLPCPLETYKRYFSLDEQQYITNFLAQP